MLHADTWEAIARGAANSATHGDIESACDVLEHAANVCTMRGQALGDMLKAVTLTDEQRRAHEGERDACYGTARELGVFVNELRAADAAVDEED